MGEDRQERRIACGFALRVADVVDGELPDRWSFRRILAVDISRTGATLIQTAPMRAQELVFVIGVAPDLSYIIARVVYCREVELDAQHRFRVGCEFTGRAVPEKTSGKLIRLEHSYTAARVND